MTSNRQGFQYAELGPQRLPGSPASYLDAFPSAKSDQSYGFELLDVGGDRFVRYSRYRRINPNDSQVNRGAYLSVGFLSGQVLPMRVAANCVDLVSQISGHLEGFIGPDNSVSKGFELPDYSYPVNRLEDIIEGQCSPLLLIDVLLQGLNSDGRLSWKLRKPISIDPSSLAREEDTDRYLLNFDKGAPGAQLRFDREREKLKDLTQRLMHAASYADQAQDDWLAYQAMMQEYLPSMMQRGTALRDLMEEVEGLAGALDSIQAPTAAFKRTARSSRSASPSSAAPARVDFRGTFGLGPGVRGPDLRTRPRTRGRGFTLRHAVFSAAGVIALAAIAAVALQFFGGQPEPSGADGFVGPIDAVTPSRSPEQEDSVEADTTENAPSSVARERAALGESTRE